MEGSGSWRFKNLRTYGFGSDSGRLLKTQGDKLVYFFALIKTEVITGSVLAPDPNLIRLNRSPKREQKNFHALMRSLRSAGGFILLGLTRQSEMLIFVLSKNVLLL
jgi:hypothetical protein